MSRSNRVFISGSAGFVGRALAGAFSRQGMEVTGSVHSPSPTGLAWKTLVHDWTQPLPKSAAPSTDLFIHSVFDRSLQHNGEMAKNGALAAQAMGAKSAILISSGSVYAESDQAIDENTPVATTDAASQFALLSQEVEAKFRENLGSIPLTIVRLFYPYGLGESPERLIPRMITAIRAGLPVKLRHDGRPRINPIFIDDVANAVLRIAEKTRDAGTLLNLGGPEVISIEKLALAIGEAVDVTVQFQEPSDGWDARDLYCSIDAVKKLTGFTPQVSLTDGLTRLLSN